MIFKKHKITFIKLCWKSDFNSDALIIIKQIPTISFLSQLMQSQLTIAALRQPLHEYDELSSRDPESRSQSAYDDSPPEQFSLEE